MASDPKKLAKYITDEIVAEFKLGGSNEQLDGFAAALSRAIHKYTINDVKVAVGIQVESTMPQTTQGQNPGDPDTTSIVKIKGETVTPGKLY